MSEQENPLLDFRAFLFLVWQHLKLPKPTRRQYAIAHYLQHGPKRKVIEAFRGIGKSWILAAYVCWRLYHNPNINILVVSASKGRADAFTTFVLRLITEIPILQHLTPGSNQRCSKVAFDVGPAPASQTPSVVSKGIGSQITGDRADIIIADDVEVTNNSATIMMREKLFDQVKEFEAILKPLPTSEIIFLGTPQNEDSIYNKLPEFSETGEELYRKRIWPARYPNEKQLAGYAGNLAPDIATELEKNSKLVGKPTESERFGDIELTKREATYGRAGFALQFMLDTSLSDVERYPLRMSDLVLTDLDTEIGPEKVLWSSDPAYLIPDIPNVGMANDRYRRAMKLADTKYMPYKGIIMAVDPSGRGKDETGYAVVAHLNGQLFLLDAGGFSDGYSPGTLESLARIAGYYKVNRILIEANFGDGMFTALLTPVLKKTYPCTMEEVKHSTQKERRIIDTLEPIMSGHRLVVNTRLVKQDYDSTLGRPSEGNEQNAYRLFYQLTRITRDRGSLLHDDRLDAVAIAVAYFTQLMAQDVETAVKTARDEALDDALRKFMDGVLGRKSSAGHVWVKR